MTGKMKKLAILSAMLSAAPAFAASGPFFSLGNTDFVVVIAFLLFVAVLVRFQVPDKLAEMLDRRADGIRADLGEARALREEARALLASFERKHEEARDQIERIVAHANTEAREAAELAREDLKQTVARRLRAAEDRIASAEAAAVRDVRDRAISVAISAASDVIAEKMTAADADALIDASIAEVRAKLH